MVELKRGSICSSAHAQGGWALLLVRSAGLTWIFIVREVRLGPRRALCSKISETIKGEPN